MKTIQLKLRFNAYPIMVGSRLLEKVMTWCPPLARGRRVVVVTHPELQSLSQPFDQLKADGYEVTRVVIPSGETSKSWEMVSHLVNEWMGCGLDRQDTVVAFGGGVIGDITGFTASIYMRGIRCIQVPTTLLAQVDSAIGGKTGVNHPLSKNAVGTFYQPDLIVADQDMLASLPRRELQSGMAEAVKYGMIGNAGLFKYIETHADRIAQYTPDQHPELWHHLITRSIADKVKVVSQDERESGLRANLNFGHTLGHALESLSQYQVYTHGEAVAIGMVAMADLAHHLGLLDQKSWIRLITLLQRLGFDTNLSPQWGVDGLLQGMRRDKKHHGDVYRLVVPRSVGSVDIMTGIPESDIRATLLRMVA